MPVLQFEAIGTGWKIDIFDEVSLEASSFLLSQIKQRIGVYEKQYSRFREDSLVTKMFREPGEYILPEDAKPILDLYKKMYDLTGGMVTPLIGSLMEETGYDAHYSLTPRELHHPPRWEDAIDYDFPRLKFFEPVLLDFGAFGKGYLIDIVSEILKKNNLEDFCIDAGGDIFSFQKDRTLHVGLENPNNFSQVIGICHLKNQSLCGSSGSRRRWRNFHHIMHPFALHPVNTILATWAIAPTALLSDALASGLFFLPGAFLRTYFDFEYVVLYPDFHVDISPGFQGKIFVPEE